MSETVYARVGERDEFPAVCTHFGAYDLEVMRKTETTVLRQSTKRYINVSTTDVVAMTRRCGTCHDIKALKHFYRDRTRGFGYRYECKDCTRELRGDREDRRFAAA